MNLMQSPWKHLADDLERQINIERDQKAFLDAFDNLLEAGQFEWLSPTLNELQSRIERKDLVG